MTAGAFAASQCGKASPYRLVLLPNSWMRLCHSYRRGIASLDISKVAVDGQASLTALVERQSRKLYLHHSEISMKSSFARSAIATIATALVLTSFSACRRTTSSDDETPDTSTYRPEQTPATEFEQKLKVVRDAHFKYVWVFSRLDGRPFTPEDSQVLHTNAPKVVDWVGMDDKKKFIAGSNFPIDPPQMGVLQKRFKIEDYPGK
jgi:hypothetical protein